MRRATAATNACLGLIVIPSLRFAIRSIGIDVLGEKTARAWDTAVEVPAREVERIIHRTTIHDGWLYEGNQCLDFTTLPGDESE